MKSPARAVSPAESARVFARIGLLSFGGPAGQIALMHRMLVEERGWLDEKRFLHALNYCMLLPGPEAMQLATYVGWLLHGVRGGLVAGLLFVLPGAVLITALSVIYLHFGDVPLVAGLLFGLQAAVLAVVLEALVRISRRALGSRAMAVVALLAFTAIALVHLPFPLVIGLAALAGALMPALAAGNGAVNEAADDVVAVPEWAHPTLRRLAGTLATWLAIWFVPLVVLRIALGDGHVLAVEAIFFSKMATVTFGGAYAVLAYVAQQAVEIYGWLMPDEMLTGLGLAETTPGPLILVLVFVGFLGGARFAGIDPLTGGLAGALVALWFTFVPCFLWIFAGAPYVEVVRNVRWLTSALATVTAAVVGVIANLALWFALHVLFASVGELAVGPVVLPMPDLASFQPASAVIAGLAAAALLRFHVSLIAVLAVSAVAGAAWTVA
ncbi:MAG: chromate efflux transporter [Rhizobiaceae bacterium]|nr:chromate efflux transporter [Rhizobiaceae bacterium]